MEQFISAFFKQFAPIEWYPNTYVLLWLMTIGIVYNIYLTVKKDSRTEKLSSILLLLGWLGVFFGVHHASYISANPEYELGEKLLYFIKLSLFSFHTLFYALFGNLLVKIIGFFVKPAIKESKY